MACYNNAVDAQEKEEDKVVHIEYFQTDFCNQNFLDRVDKKKVVDEDWKDNCGQDSNPEPSWGLGAENIWQDSANKGR